MFDTGAHNDNDDIDDLHAHCALQCAQHATLTKESVNDMIEHMKMGGMRSSRAKVLACLHERMEAADECTQTDVAETICTYNMELYLVDDNLNTSSYFHKNRAHIRESKLIERLTEAQRYEALITYYQLVDEPDSGLKVFARYIHPDQWQANKSFAYMMNDTKNFVILQSVLMILLRK